MAGTAPEFTPQRPKPLEMSRDIKAPREVVFEAFSSAEHIKQWFCPANLTVPEAIVEFQAGGRFDVCMQMPNGLRHWTRARFDDITPPERIVFSGSVDSGGKPGFNVRTVITFAAIASGTRLDVRQEYEILDPAFLGAVAGAHEGWRTTLDKLEGLAGRLWTGGEK